MFVWIPYIILIHIMLILLIANFNQLVNFIYSCMRRLKTQNNTAKNSMHIKNGAVIRDKHMSIRGEGN